MLVCYSVTRQTSLALIEVETRLMREGDDDAFCVVVGQSV